MINKGIKKILLTAGVADLSRSAGDTRETADGFAFDKSLAETWSTAFTADRLWSLGREGTNKQTKNNSFFIYTLIIHINQGEK